MNPVPAWLPRIVLIAASFGWSASGAEMPANPFRLLDESWPTPTDQRRASGAPGRAYWQQQADYEIDVTLDDEKQVIRGSGKITYFNRSPDDLTYLWVQLDQNYYRQDSGHWLGTPAPNLNSMSYDRLKGLLYNERSKGGYTIRGVEDANGKKLKHTIVGTMMRIDLPEPLESGGQLNFRIDWRFRIPDAKTIFSRMGCEYFEKDKNYIYAIAQWFPRMASYTDVHGWQNKQYIGSEFTLEFGDYLVRITVPSDHIVAATGVLQNPEQVLSKQQRERLEKAAAADKPVLIVTKEEAAENEKSKPKDTRTWIFKAENVRDFAFASSRKFMWDAQGRQVGDRTVMAMSYWPKEGEPLWSRYSTHAIVHTLDVYSRFTFDYPYPVAISVNGPVTGMEYPMICWQKPRPESDGTYSAKTKYYLISVIIHEVGHNWFPMIVNSDERRWMWMDEGFNSFCQFLAEREWEHDYPDRLTDPKRRDSLKQWLRSDRQRPIMSDSDTLIHRGNNAYTKPTLALNVLRETILGRELFDFAFKEYANRWKFKRPTPYDFFRTMEDASGVDLDWFWRGWFYTTDHVDIAIENVRHFHLDTRNPRKEKARQREERDAEPDTLTQQRNDDIEKRVERFPELLDFYNRYDPLEFTAKDREDRRKLMKNLDPGERRLLRTKEHFYTVDFRNLGGLVMPLILEIEFEDGTKESRRYPAELWRKDSDKLSKLILTSKPVKSIAIDPLDETFDTDRSNNRFPRRLGEETFRLQKSKPSPNPMQIDRQRKERRQKEREKKKSSQAPEAGDEKNGK